MTTPNRTQIYEKAKELWVQDCYRNGARGLADKTPEYSELAESGFVAAAQSMLMSRGNPNVVVIEKGEEETETLAKKGVEVDLEEVLKSGSYVCGTSGSGKSHLVMYVVDHLLKKGVVVYVVDPSQDWLRNSSVALAVTVPENIKVPVYNQSMIYDTSLLGIKKQRAFTESLCKVVMNHAKSQREEERRWRIIVFEEAQLVFPEGCFRAIRNDYSIQLASMGRNYKVRFIAITPFSANVDKMLVKITGQRFFGWTCEKNDLEYLRGFLGEKVEALPRLKAGQFIYHAPQLGKCETIEIQPHGQNVSSSNHTA